MSKAGAPLFLSLALLAGSCAGPRQQQQQQQQPHLARHAPQLAATPAPPWVRHIEIREDKLCGVGVAGAGYDESSPYPRKLAEERAVRNLAGVLETNIQEAIIDRSTASKTAIEFARALHVDEALIEQVGAMVETDFWYDAAGEGPFAQKSFTYGRSCIDAKIAAERFKLNRATIQGKAAKKRSAAPERVPGWLSRTGKQPGGRLCAVGFSLPTFHPDKTFEVVVEDVRGQLSDVLQTLVSSYYEELTTERYQIYEAMTVATTQAISKGAIVTHFWHDRDGIGPHRRKRTTYGWGCVYPVDVMLKSVSQVEQQLPEQVVAKVRERAEKAFDELDAEIDKRSGPPAGHVEAPAAETPAERTPAPTPGLGHPEPAPSDPPPAMQPEPAAAAEPAGRVMLLPDAADEGR